MGESRAQSVLSGKQRLKASCGFGQKDQVSAQPQDCAASMSCWLVPAVSGVLMGLRNKAVGQLAQRLCSPRPLDLQDHMNSSALAFTVKNEP